MTTAPWVELKTPNKGGRICVMVSHIVAIEGMDAVGPVIIGEKKKPGECKVLLKDGSAFTVDHDYEELVKMLEIFPDAIGGGNNLLTINDIPVVEPPLYEKKG